MSALGQAKNWLRTHVARRRLERDMRDEMAIHVEQIVERLMARGLTRRQAEVEARREFGNTAVLQEEARDARGGRWVDDLGGDLRYAFRYFARTPLLSITIILTLMLGIGINGALLTLLEGVTTRPAPGVPNDPSVVLLDGTMRFGARNQLVDRDLALREVLDYRRIDAFEDVATWVGRHLVVSTGSNQTTAYLTFVEFVSGNYFDVAGVRLALGPGFVQRQFDALDDPEMSVVLAHAFWRDRFGGDSSVVGRRIQVNGREVVVAGVAPPRFNGMKPSSASRTVWVPLSAMQLIDSDARLDFATYEERRYSAVARIAEGSSFDAARAAVTIVAARAVGQMLPPRNARNLATDLRPISRPMAWSRDTELPLATAMLGGVGLLVLLVCCTNVSSLLVGSAIRRRHEIAVRLSMGAGRWRIVRQLLTEAVMLSLAGAALGISLYWIIVARTGHLIRDIDITPDGSSILGAIGVSLLTALICGLSPSLHVTRVELSTLLKDSPTTVARRSRLQGSFVVAQVALTQPLLVALAMMVAVLVTEMTSQQDAGAGDRILRANFGAFGAEGTRTLEQSRSLRDRIAGIPGVVGVAPVSNQISLMSLRPHDGLASDRAFRTRLETVWPGHFKLMGTPMLRGREFQAGDVGLGEMPAIVDDALARELWGDADPIGRRLGPSGGRGGKPVVIVGVIAQPVDERPHGENRRMFVPPPAGVQWMGGLLIRTAGPAEPYIPMLRAIGAAQTPVMPLVGAKTLGQMDRERRATMLQAMAATAGGGLLALLLGAIGLYAVVALSVGQRTKEIGIRISLGATPSTVVRMFFGRGLRLGAIGVVIGLPLSVAAGQVLIATGEAPTANMLVIGGTVLAAVVAVAAFASWLPARRAAGVDPLAALRTE